jgi:hypothetical protein
MMKNFMHRRFTNYSARHGQGLEAGMAKAKTKQALASNSNDHCAGSELTIRANS